MLIPSFTLNEIKRVRDILNELLKLLLFWHRKVFWKWLMKPLLSWFYYLPLLLRIFCMNLKRGRRDREWESDSVCLTIKGRQFDFSISSFAFITLKRISKQQIYVIFSWALYDMVRIENTLILLFFSLESFLGQIFHGSLSASRPWGM